AGGRRAPTGPGRRPAPPEGRPRPVPSPTREGPRGTCQCSWLQFPRSARVRAARRGDGQTGRSSAARAGLLSLDRPGGLGRSQVLGLPSKFGHVSAPLRVTVPDDRWVDPWVDLAGRPGPSGARPSGIEVVLWDLLDPLPPDATGRHGADV